MHDWKNAMSDYMARCTYQLIGFTNKAGSFFRREMTYYFYCITSLTSRFGDVHKKDTFIFYLMLEITDGKKKCLIYFKT